MRFPPGNTAPCPRLYSPARGKPKMISSRSFSDSYNPQMCVSPVARIGSDAEIHFFLHWSRDMHCCPPRSLASPQFPFVNRRRIGDLIQKYRFTAPGSQAWTRAALLRILWRRAFWNDEGTSRFGVCMVFPKNALAAKKMLKFSDRFSCQILESNWLDKKADFEKTWSLRRVEQMRQ